MPGRSRFVVVSFALYALYALSALGEIVAAVSLRAQAPQADLSRPLTLENALDLAMSRNLGLEAARRQRAIRDAAVRTARLIPNPDVGVDFTQDVPHYGITFNIPIEIGRKRGRRIDLAKEELTLAEVDLQTEMRTVRHDVRAAFYSLLAADQQVQLADTALTIARSLHDAAQQRFDAGAAPRLEVLQADLGVARAETDLDLARSARTAQQATLDGVLNLPPQRMLAPAGALSDHLAAPAFDSALALATASNVDLVRLDKEITIEQRRLDLVRAERTPTPVFSVGGVFNSPDLSAGIGGSVGIVLPIFSRNQGEIAASIAATSQLRAQRDAMRRTVETSVFGTLAKIDAQRKQFDAYQQRLVPTAANLETLAEESYRAGRTSVLGVLDAQRNLRDFRREALQAALDLQLLLADLEETLGTALP
jgi:cobalt-zinc-cadmium efflux system outer membrane protein